MAYRIMTSLIKSGKKPKEELLDMADVFYASGRMNNEEYAAIVDKINGKEDENK